MRRAPGTRSKPPAMANEAEMLLTPTMANFSAAGSAQANQSGPITTWPATVAGASHAQRTAVRNSGPRDGQWPENEAEAQQGDTQAQQPLLKELAHPLAAQRCRREVAGEQAEHPREKGLVDGAGDRQRKAGRCAAVTHLSMASASAAPAGDRRVVQDHQRGQHDAQAVDEEGPPGRNAALPTAPSPRVGVSQGNAHLRSGGREVFWST